MASESELQAEIERLQSEVRHLRDENKALKKDEPHLSLEEYRRYGRQMQVPEFGSLSSQLKVKGSKVLVIGAGGLGSPAILYLAAAGVGKIGIVDHDRVEVTNLHRQIIHDTDSVGMYKAESARKRIRALNPNVEVVTHCVALSNLNSFSIIENYDLVLDCTDTPAIRYLINDTCVLLGKTIVSGSGVGTEGQLSILNFHNKGPCYRCFYPSPPPANTVTSCSDGGVIGPCIGILGVMMAVEALKCLTGFYTDETFSPFLCLYSGYTPFQKARVFKMRPRSPKCDVCGSETSVTRAKIESGEVDYKGWCGSVNYNVLSREQRITASELAQVDFTDTEHVNPLLDVRPRAQYEIAHLDHSLNIPTPELKKLKELPVDPSKKTYVICRFGNDSQICTKVLEDKVEGVKDVIGGFSAWQKTVDPEFPAYW